MSSKKKRSVEDFYEEYTEILTDLKAKVVLTPSLKLCAKAVMVSYESMLMKRMNRRLTRAHILINTNQYAQNQANAASRKKRKFKMKTTFDSSEVHRPQNVPNCNGSWNPNPRTQTRNQSREYREKFKKKVPNFILFF